MDIEIKNLYHASKYMKCTSKCNIQVYKLDPPTCVLKILIDPLTLSYFSPYVKVLPLVITSPPITLYLCFSPPLSLMTTKGLILDRLRLSMSINGVSIILPNLVQSSTLAKDI